ncbi:MAG: NYN domain-containing protein [Acidobacteriota bacterium]
MQNDERRIAVYIDFENVAMGVRESKYGNFDIDLVLKRLVEKGKIIVKRAYSDWHRYSEFKRAFHQVAIELIDVPQTRYSGKNSADIRMVVDALDMSYQKDHIDTFVLVTGDSDFSPLVSKLRENGRYVIGIGVKQSSSELLVSNCDEFIYYEDLVRPTASTPALDPKISHLSPKKTEALRLVLETFLALQREGKETIYGSMIKQTLIRKMPSFNETYYGYPIFSRLLEDAAEHKLLKLTKDQKSGGYLVTLPSEETEAPAAGSESSLEAGTIETAPAEAAAAPGSGEQRDRGRRSRWGRGRWDRSPQRIAEASKERPVEEPATAVEVATEASLAPSPALQAHPQEPLADAADETTMASPPEPAEIETAVKEAPAAPQEAEPKARSTRSRRGRRGRGGRGPREAVSAARPVGSLSEPAKSQETTPPQSSTPSTSEGTPPDLVGVTTEDVSATTLEDAAKGTKKKRKTSSSRGRKRSSQKKS